MLIVPLSTRLKSVVVLLSIQLSTAGSIVKLPLAEKILNSLILIAPVAID
jgi:hypothetical protein